MTQNKVSLLKIRKEYKTMRKIFLLSVCILTTSILFAQEQKAKDSVSNWTRTGVATLLFNQSSFNNWVAGGENNVAGTLNINYDVNYKKADWTWDNKFIFSYGASKIGGADIQKTDDRLEINSLLGKKAGGYWYYSAFFNFRTQLDTGLDPETNVRNSHFYSPAFHQLGPGMLWKKSDNLKVNIAPLTSKLIVVSNKFTEFGPSFGVEQGNTSRFEFGAAIGAYYKFKAMENVTFENILNLYSNYIEDPQNVDVDYTLNLVMKINKYLSANFAFQTIYDDNAFEGFQVRQVLGIGANYTF